MFKLLKGGHCYIPDDIGKKNILTICGKIYKIDDNIPTDKLWDVEVIDCSKKLVLPGIIDQHVHILGGGGENGPQSRIPEIQLSEIIKAGVTTLVGVLGFDSITRTVSNLLAKANALQLDGITSYIYTGSYAVPTATLTGKVISDISLIDKVLGVGEIALADHRSSHPDLQTLMSLSSEARIGGLIGSKAGIVHIHVGDGKEGLKLLFRLLEESDYPIEMFVPTHINRNKTLFEQGIAYLDKGGYIDLTAGQPPDIGYTIPDALEKLIRENKNMSNITISSDGNGSNPIGNSGTNASSICLMSQLFEDIKTAILQKGLDITTVIKTVTTNVSKVLKLYPQKGTLAAGSDADIIILNEDTLDIDCVIATGQLLMKDGKILKKGRFEI